MNLHVTGRAICILRILIMLRASRLNRPNVMRDAVAGQAQLIDGAVLQQTRIGRAVRCMTGRAPFGLDRSVFISEWPLFVRVAFNTSRIRTCRQPGLLEFKSPMRVMAITATHRAFQNFVMEGRREGRLHLAVATDTQLRVIRFQHSDG